MTTRFRLRLGVNLRSPRNRLRIVPSLSHQFVTTAAHRPDEAFHPVIPTVAQCLVTTADRRIVTTVALHPVTTADHRIVTKATHHHVAIVNPRLVISANPLLLITLVNLYPAL